jgi:hypothetical protein
MSSSSFLKCLVVTLLAIGEIRHRQHLQLWDSDLFFFRLCWLFIFFRHRMAELADSSPQSPTDLTQAAGAKDDENNDQDNQQFGQTYSL